MKDGHFNPRVGRPAQAHSWALPKSLIPRNASRHHGGVWGVSLCGSKWPIPPTPLPPTTETFRAGVSSQDPAASWALPPLPPRLGHCFVVLTCFCSEEMVMFCFAWSCLSFCLSLFTLARHSCVLKHRSVLVRRMNRKLMLSLHFLRSNNLWLNFCFLMSDLFLRGPIICLLMLCSLFFKIICFLNSEFWHL